jgi:membrane-anchored glycerophosphoryl diester phosphodiesterase (GDPDase)
VGFYVLLLVVFLVIALCAALLVGGMTLQPDGGAAMAIPLVVLMMLLYVALLVATLYFAIRFVALLPLIAIERVYNPFTAIARAWHLTKRDAWKLVGFWALMWIAVTIIFMAIVLTVAGSLFQLGGPPPTLETLIPLWLAIIPVNIAVGIVLTALAVATYNQLAAAETATPEPAA